MDLGLDGKVALVTGASKGIGRGIAAELVAEGARVAISSHSRERVEATAAELGATPYVHDTADLDHAAVLVTDATEALGPIDILVCNTGGPPGGPDPLAFTREQWEAAHRTLVQSPMAFLERLLPGMRERGFGRVVAIGSIAVREPVDVLQLSNSHRPGLVAAFKVLAGQAARDGVTLNHVHPGRIATERVFGSGTREEAEARAREVVPAGRLGTVEELAAAAVFLCSVPAGYITGTSLLVDGGLSRSVS